MLVPTHKKRSFSIGQRTLMLVCFPLVAEITFVIFLTGLHFEAEAQAEHAARARETTAFVNRTIADIYALGKKIGGYKLRASALNGRNDETLLRVKADLEGIDSFKPVSAQQAVVLKRVHDRGGELLALVERARKLMDPPSLQNILYVEQHAAELTNSCSILFDDLQAVVEEDNKVEDNVPIIQSKIRHQSLFIIYALVAVNALVAVFLTVLYNRDILRRLSVVMDNAHRLATHKPLHPRLSGNDEIAQLDSVFNDMAEAMDHAARVKQELFSMVSHDLRTPLTSIQAALSIVLEGVYGTVPPEAARTLVIAERDTRRLVALVLDLLEIARLDEGGVELQKEQIAVGSLLQQVSESFDPDCSSKNVSVETVADQNLSVFADEYRLTQVLVNLVSNALKYAPAGSRITLSAQATEQGCRFTVEDEGCGVHEGALETIFERFKQARISDRESGFGLGLSICARIVEVHQGSIGVENRVPQGARFWFVIPMEGQNNFDTCQNFVMNRG